MDWNKIGEIALSVIVAFGGAGAIAIGAVKWISKILADRLSRKYQLQLDEKLETVKTALNKKEYISKTRFDAEFRMYQELSEKNIAMVYCAGEAPLRRGSGKADQIEWSKQDQSPRYDQPPRWKHFDRGLLQLYRHPVCEESAPAGGGLCIRLA